MKFLLRFMSGIFYKLSYWFNYYHALPQSRRVKQWVKLRGDETLRLNYPSLNENSIVFDLGGYKGQWASDIYSKYNCSVYIFEPHSIFAENIRDRFLKNNRIRLFRFGLGKETEIVPMNISGDASSLFRDLKGKTEDIEIRNVGEFMHEYSIRKIDLMKINIEGAEYDLLDALLDGGLISRIDNIQVQFHDFIPDAETRMKKIRERLKATHHCTWQNKFVWENWERNV